jgi:hypothetical protein
MNRGYNMGTRLIEDFLARTGLQRCSTFAETAEVISKVCVLFSLFIPPLLSIPIYTTLYPMLGCIEKELMTGGIQDFLKYNSKPLIPTSTPNNPKRRTTRIYTHIRRESISGIRGITA